MGLIKKLALRVRRSFVLNSYDDFTIAEYFRSQGARIGENNRLEIRSLAGEPYLVTIGNHCTISPNVQLLTHDGAGWIFTEEIPDLQKFGPITIHDNCFIGLNSIILPNVTIGPNAVVGAGSVVTRDVAPGTIVAGNPARKISTIEKYREKVVETWRQQKPRNYFRNQTAGSLTDPAAIHARKIRDGAMLRDHLEKLFGCGQTRSSENEAL